jgi:hypothetical protein
MIGRLTGRASVVFRPPRVVTPRRPSPARHVTSLSKPIRGIVSAVDSRRKLEHDPEKHALGLDPMGGNRFSEKIMLKQRARA